MPLPSGSEAAPERVSSRMPQMHRSTANEDWILCSRAIVSELVERTVMCAVEKELHTAHGVGALPIRPPVIGSLIGTDTFTSQNLRNLGELQT